MIAGKPLRVLYYTEVRHANAVGRLLCNNCGRGLDIVSQKEIEALETGAFGVPLCRKCEKVCCLQCGTRYYSRARLNDLRTQGGVCIFCFWENRGWPIAAFILHLAVMTNTPIKEILNRR